MSVFRSVSGLVRAAVSQPAHAGALRPAALFTPFRGMKTATAQLNYAGFTDEELAEMVINRDLSQHKLEDVLKDTHRAVEVRRLVIENLLAKQGVADTADVMQGLPNGDFDYKGFYNSIYGTNCEAVIGYMPIPVGAIGPLTINGKKYTVPMATTEGALLASTNRGARAIDLSDGARVSILKNGMTRAPLLRVPSAAYGAQMAEWIQQPENQDALKAAFNSTTRFGRLQKATAYLAGRNLYVRFACHCGDAMGMNMVTKGTVEALKVLKENFPEAHMVALSGNVCADKKPAAINWVEGRGRSIVCEVVLKKDVVERVLKTTVDEMIFVNSNKNLIGSAVAGSIGGFNAHAGNNVAAVFLATGQDPAQVTESATCLTQLEREGEDLHMSVTMPSIEVGTVGGGTSLPAQTAALKMLGCQGANREQAGKNADTLASVVAATTLAGEVSLIAALATNDLLNAHINLNRKTDAPPSNTSSTSASTDTPTFSTQRSLHTTSAILGYSTIGDPSTGGPRNASTAPVFTEALYTLPGSRVEFNHSSHEPHCCDVDGPTFSFP